ncbi:Nitrilase/cyanide hydratase and apolipoprotein N-acyltransferase [Roseiflexus castenholzii DSM 13941]|uniref:Nitrilase/cyanide hydratase and apolipoprotein N-acyltransferase n=2 Tax=Roseiflexaceae TaxID=1508635 RepID=A7NPQ9_ROSCS|nr:Nitrilase/cyanide hydratase and apolipoprotein N-acyltransferase [Roseiflexus castenholzii DSM 13941]
MAAHFISFTLSYGYDSLQEEHRMSQFDSYRALALQVTCHAVNALNNRVAVREQMLATIVRLREQIRASIAFIGNDVRLVVLPEYFLTGFPLGESIAVWSEKAAIDPDGPEYAALGQIACDLQIFLAGNCYERDPHFPGLYFQVSFVIDPSGQCVLRYRRLNSMFAPTPHDVWDRFCQMYGPDALFPVADTAIGRLACIASEEILFPEVARCLAMRGAEVFLHSSSEVSSPELTPKHIAKRARALENLAYVISANSAGISGIPIPAASVEGGSQIVDYTGRVLVEAGQGESMAAHAEIDLAALRRYRRRPGMNNLLSRQRFDLYASSYATAGFYPPNTLLTGVAERQHFLRVQQETIERLAQKGII